MEELEFNAFAEKLNVELATQEIGPSKDIKLMFDKKGDVRLRPAWQAICA